MALKDFYKLTYGEDAKPFESNKDFAEFIYRDILAANLLYQKIYPEKITSLDVYSTLLYRMGLRYEDVYFCLCELLDDTADGILFETYTDNELFDDCREDLLKLSKSTLSKLNINKEKCGQKNEATYFNIFLLAGIFPLTGVINKELNFQEKDLTKTDTAKDFKATLKFFHSIKAENANMGKATKLLVDKLNITIEEVAKAREFVLENTEQNLLKQLEKYINEHNKTTESKTDVLTQKQLTVNNIQKIKEAVVGQEEAVERVQKRLMSALVGFKNDNQPIASFLLTGPTGVGKTETAKAVAKCYFDNKFYVVDMSTYKNHIDVSRLLGASPNYIGYGDKNGFCEFIKENPRSVILFDEIEKAHPDCLDILMRILDEGKFINAKGEELSLENCVIFCTTNISESKRPTVGFGAKSSIDEYVISECAGLRKETVGRFSEVINYSKLSKSSAKQILKTKFMKNVLEGFEKRNNKGLLLQCNEDIVDAILDEANISLFGARDLKKAIQKIFVNPVTNYILENDPHDVTLVVSKNGISEIKPFSVSEKTDGREN